MYRAKSWDIGVAGLQPVELPGATNRQQDENGSSLSPAEQELVNELHGRSIANQIENVDITELVRYLCALKRKLSSKTLSLLLAKIDSSTMTTYFYSTHGDYPAAMFRILKRVNLEMC